MRHARVGSGASRRLLPCPAQTGGEDDLVSIWCLPTRTLVCRGEGHSSWVTAVAFDAHAPGGTGRPRLGTAPAAANGTNGSAGPGGGRGPARTILSLGSAGADTKLLFWEVEVEALPSAHPNGVATTSGPSSTRARGGARALVGNGRSAEGDHTLAIDGAGRGGSGKGLEGDPGARGLPSHAEAAAVVPAVALHAVPLIRPVSAACAHGEPITQLVFTPAAVLSICMAGHLREWTPQRSGQGSATALQTQHPTFNLVEVHTTAQNTISAGVKSILVDGAARGIGSRHSQPWRESWAQSDT